VRYRTARVRVAQQSLAPLMRAMDWVEKGLSPSSAHRSRTNLSYEVCSYSELMLFGEEHSGR